MARRLRDKDGDWADVVGMPDKWDLQNMQTAINNFMQKKFRLCDVYNTEKHDCQHPRTISGKQWIALSVKASRESTQLGDNPFNQYGIKSEASEARIVSSIPLALHNDLYNTMPTVFRDKRHFSWFIKNFKQYFIVPDKY